MVITWKCIECRHRTALHPAPNLRPLASSPTPLLSHRINITLSSVSHHHNVRQFLSMDDSAETNLYSHYIGAPE